MGHDRVKFKAILGETADLKYYKYCTFGYFGPTGAVTQVVVVTDAARPGSWRPICGGTKIS